MFTTAGAARSTAATTGVRRTGPSRFATTVPDRATAAATPAAARTVMAIAGFRVISPPGTRPSDEGPLPPTRLFNIDRRDPQPPCTLLPAPRPPLGRRRGRSGSSAAQGAGGL